MRTVIAACLALLIPTPALADQAAADRYIQEQWDKIAVMRAETAKRESDQKSLCSHVGGARVGMAADAVRKSCWGKPARVNTTATAGHSHEQWVYGGSQYVYLTDGVVTSIQTSR